MRSASVYELRAAPNLAKFLALTAQLALLLVVFRVFQLEKPEFLRIAYITVGAFLIHYWLPFRFKEPFWAATSVAGAFLVLAPQVAALLIVVGLAFFLLLRSPISFRWRWLTIGAVFALFAYGCAMGTLPIPAAFYPVFGGIFMFRIVIYAYDQSHGVERGRLVPFLSYFFILPNYYFTFFPVIDFQTQRRTYFQRDVHEIAQQGIGWILRGVIQLLLYRLVTYFNDPYLPDRINSFPALLTTMVLTLLLYLNVSGHFHLIVGMLHLFGYDLPETNRRYFLGNSFSDWFRRINIYWKDFMVKMVYFPVYFKLRKKGDVRAQMIATGLVILVSWVLHAYQFFWIRSSLNITWTDAIFWWVVGALMMWNIWRDSKRKRRLADTSWRGRAKNGVSIAGTFAVMTVLWSLWNAPTFGSWVYFMTHWARVGK